MSDRDTNSKRIKWDEEVIAEHDKERGARQKIDEPPTPFAYESDRESVDSDVNQYDNPEPDITENVFHISEEVTKKQENEDFKNKRASHYNEFKLLQALRAKMEEEEDDDEEEEEEVNIDVVHEEICDTGGRKA